MELPYLLLVGVPVVELLGVPILPLLSLVEPVFGFELSELLARKRRSKGTLEDDECS